MCHCLLIPTPPLTPATPHPAYLPTYRPQLLSEYLASHDGAEASRCLRGLGVSFFHHELVKQALLSALEAPAHTEPVLDLLRRCVPAALPCH